MYQKLGLISIFAFLFFFIGATTGHRHEKFHHKLAERSQLTFKTIGYYVNWAIYARNFPPQDIQASALTHVLYAFAGINNQTGEVYLTDTWADIEKTWPGDIAPAANSTDPYLFGNLKQLYLLKKKNRNMKTLLSIGGWGLRTSFAPALTNSTRNQETFANSSVILLKDLGFDGIDIDWEYPSSPTESAALVSTCRHLRSALDTYSSTLPSTPHFLLTLAVPAGPANYQYFDVPALEPYVDLLMLMGYDYQGSFSDHSGHNANLYKSVGNLRSTDFDSEGAVRYYTEAGGGSLPREKFVLGMPLYGRSFANTSGPGMRFSLPTDGSWENGIWDYKALPLNQTSTHIYTDPSIGASWSYSNTTHYMVSYDTPSIAAQKAKYVEEGGRIGGAMWWELSGDRPLNDSRSLIRTVRESFEKCEGGIEYCENVLEYPESKYTNLREGMVGE